MLVARIASNNNEQLDLLKFRLFSTGTTRYCFHWLYPSIPMTPATACVNACFLFLFVQDVENLPCEALTSQLPFFNRFVLMVMVVSFFKKNAPIARGELEGLLNCINLG